MDPYQTNFDFYLKCIKPLVLNLSKIHDRILSAAWIKRIINEPVMETKINCLKLLLFILQKKQLYKPFNIHPNNYKSLDEIQKWNLQFIADSILKNNLQNTQTGPHYITDCSENLLEYVAVQEIPRFGTHAYYAFSNSPLPVWNRVEKAYFQNLNLPAYLKRATSDKGVLE